MLDSGLGETGINTLFSALNIPTVHHKSLKRYERKITPVIEEVAQESCRSSIILEKNLTLQNDLSHLK